MLILVISTLKNLKELLIGRQVNLEMFGEAMYENGFISVDVKVKAGRSNYKEAIAMIMSAAENHLTSQPTEKLVEKRLHVLVLLNLKQVSNA